MKRPDKNLYTPMTWLLLAALSLLAAACAAPQTPNGLQQRIDELLLVQQQQAQQLTQLQQQLAGLAAEPQGSPGTTIGPTSDMGQPTQAAGAVTGPLQVPVSAAELAAISETANLYLEAFAALATGQMAEAEARFEAFIQRFPEHQYTGNANYWLAETLLAQQKSKRAETILLSIIDNPKQQNKAPAAMARLVKYYRESNAQNNAAAMLQMLSDHYPESPELNRLMRSTEPR